MYLLIPGYLFFTDLDILHQYQTIHANCSYHSRFSVVLRVNPEGGLTAGPVIGKEMQVF